MRKVGRISTCHAEVCLLLSLTVCLAVLESQLISKVWPSSGQSVQPPWRGRNTWHCSGSNSCCFLFSPALIALGTGEANCPAATAQVVLRCSEWVEGIKSDQETYTYGSTCGTAQASEQHKYHIYLAHQSKVLASICWWGGGAKPASDCRLLFALRLFCSTLSQGTAIEQPEDCG